MRGARASEAEGEKISIECVDMAISEKQLAEWKRQQVTKNLLYGQ